MKKHIPSLLIGIVFGFLLALSPVVYGASQNVIQAMFQNFNYQVHGMDVVVTESALIYEGNTYLKTREIARILGYEAVYDASTRTINFISVNSVNEEENGGDSLSATIEKEIKEIENKINILKRNIEGTERVKNLFNVPEENIQKMKDELNQLEAQKAELEAQLEQQKAEP